ncbi:MAG: hypothetical protein LRZ84_14465 [Desertifilum sp.]|nr:hypothetical protein [Desertifilum sp.]
MTQKGGNTDVTTLSKGFWTLLASGFMFGLTERLTVTVQQPSAQNIGLLTIATLFGLCAAFSCPFVTRP